MLATTVRRLMDFLTQGQLDWAPMDPHYDRFFIGDRVYDAVAGRAEFRDNLVAHFPREARAIDRYLQLLGEVSRGMRTFTLDRTLPPWAAAVAGPLLRRRLPPSFDRTDLGRAVGTDRRPGTDRGADRPVGRHGTAAEALVVRDPGADREALPGWRLLPGRGAWRIADTILPRIRATGGEVFTYARVEQVLVQDGRTRGVRMADGTEIAADRVISDAGAINTFARLLPAAVARQHGYDQLVKQVKPSIGHLGVYIGLQGTAEEFGLPKTNYRIYPGNDYDAALDRFLADPHGPFPAVYISFPSAKDPDFARRHPARPRSRSWPLRRTRSSRPGRTAPGASAAKTTKR